MTKPMSRAQRRRERRQAAASRLLPDYTWRFVPFFLMCAALYAYHNSLYGPFVFDDLRAIPNNPTIRRLWPPREILSTLPRSAVSGRPIVNMSLAVNYALGGLNVWGYHAFNLGVHVLAGLALFGVVRRTLLGPRLRDRYGHAAPSLAAAIALIWVVHPLLTESVTYTIQRTELLMGLFFLLTLYCAIRGLDSRRRGRWHAAAAASCALGMGSKEIIVSAPVVVMVYDRLFLNASFEETLRRRWRLYAALAASWLIFAALAGARIYAGFKGMEGGADSSLGASPITPWVYAKTQAGVIVHYLRLSLWPHPLASDYDGWPMATAVTTVLPAMTVVVALLGATLLALWYRQPLAFLGVWFFAILAPTSSLWPITTEIAAERRMYLPLAAVVTLVVLGGHWMMGKLLGREAQARRRGAVEAALVVVIVAILAQLSVRRNEDYRSTVSFWSDVIRKRPDNARARINLGDHLYKQGQTDEALGHYSEAARINPSNALAHYGLGVTLGHRGRSQDAIAHYREALRIRPRYAEAKNNLGNELVKQGQLEEALLHLVEAIEISPNYALAYFNLGLTMGRLGRIEEAVQYLGEAVTLNPGHKEARRALDDLQRRASARGR